MRIEKLVLLLGTALCLLLLGAAGWHVHQGALQAARTAALQRLQAAATAHDALQAARARELLLIARQLGNDKGFVGYIAQAVRQSTASGAAIDSASIRDLLDERRSQLGFDIAMVLDNTGRTLVDTASFHPSHGDLARHAGVAATLQTLEPSSGYLFDREQAIQIAVAPLLLGATSEGLVLTGLALDDQLAQQIAAIAGGDAALLVNRPEGAAVVAASLALPLRQELARLAADGNWLSDTNVRELSIPLDGSTWLARIQPSSQRAAVGSLITLVPDSTIEAASADSTRRLLLAVVVIAAALLLLAGALWQLLLHPLGRIAAAVEPITRGSLESVKSSGRFGVARITAALNRVVGELRETRDFEAYSADLLRQRIRHSETAPRAEATAAIEHGPLANKAAGNVVAARYEIYGKVGSGPAGIVYRALDRQHGEVIALKLLGASALVDAAHAAHVKTLLRAGARVVHPNVARLRDVGQDAGLIYIATEYVRGISLKDALVRTGRVPLYAALRVAREICAGLAAIHAAATAHGALHPANIFLAPGVATKLLDIGLVAPPPQFNHHRPDQALRSDPTYLSPQQIVGQLANERDDVYALGLILTEVFTARLPHTFHNTSELCVARIEREPIAPSRLWTEIPAAIETLLLGCLERDPARRFADAGVVQRELDRCRL